MRRRNRRSTTTLLIALATGVLAGACADGTAPTDPDGNGNGGGGAPAAYDHDLAPGASAADLLASDDYDFLANLTGGDVPELDQNCLDDLQANGRE